MSPSTAMYRAASARVPAGRSVSRVEQGPVDGDRAELEPALGIVSGGVGVRPDDFGCCSDRPGETVKQVDADVEDDGPATGWISLPGDPEPLPTAGDVPDGGPHWSPRVLPLHELPEPEKAVVVAQLQDRMDNMPGLCLQRG